MSAAGRLSLVSKNRVAMDHDETPRLSLRS